MEPQNWILIEQIQTIVVKALARNPAGLRLYLIGGFRLRFLDSSCRFSRDIDYYWEGDLEAKQKQVCAFLQKHVVPEITRATGYEGSALPATGPAAESAAVKTVDLAFWRIGPQGARVEIPVDIMNFDCTDKTTVKTVHGVLLPTPSDRDIIESKVIALLNRWPLQERDFIDLFLFEKNLAADSSGSITQKLNKRLHGPSVVKEKLAAILSASKMHIAALDELIKTQLEPMAAAHLLDAGGGAVIFRRGMEILRGLHLETTGSAE